MSSRLVLEKTQLTKGVGFAFLVVQGVVVGGKAVRRDLIARASLVGVRVPVFESGWLCRWEGEVWV